MPPVGVIAVAALAAISYVYVGAPVAHVVKRGVVCPIGRVFHHKCKDKAKKN